MLTKWIEFTSPVKSASGKTDVWYITGLKSGAYLGSVKWNGGWRKYTFSSSDNTFFDADCLREIADFCETETRKLRQQWRTR